MSGESATDRRARRRRAPTQPEPTPPSTDACSGRASDYRIRIRYREPDFERRNGPRDEPFSWTFEIRATTASAAESAAIREFHDIARQSSVCWERVIVDVEVLGGGAF